ncbi:reverse transcriptase [Caerostris extrusa]|uniref:Reverse transcriptase n=1 Tax=Caerostris extrusa TaxID=172846 RepID=A0AAV4SNZ6_CAEEX|nr:reverse transcriptase [Caerostris extrusa]
MFKKWRNRVIELKKIAIPRRLSRLSFKQGKISIHVFCDACKTSYATCIFLRNEFQNQVTCQLQARSREIAPLKNITIVRLELLTCCIGARLADTVKKDLNLEDVDVFYWSDSMDALHWIKKEGPWKTFFENRVREIRKLSEDEADVQQESCERLLVETDVEKESSFLEQAPPPRKLELYDRALEKKLLAQQVLEDDRTVWVSSVTDLSSVLAYFHESTNIFHFALIYEPPEDIPEIPQNVSSDEVEVQTIRYLLEHFCQQ